MNGLSFLFPSALGLAVLAPLIVLAYLNRTPLKKRVVSSLLLLKQLPKTPAMRDRVQLPWRFFLELLILGLLAFLAAYPKLTSRGQKIGVLLDNSLSMNALNGGETRFDRAKKELKKWLELQDRRDTYSLYVTSPKLIRVSEEFVSDNDFLAALEKTRMSAAPDYADGALSQLVSSGQYEKIFVVSDKQASFSTSPSSGKQFPIDARTVGEAAPNIALVNLRLERKKDLPPVVVASLALFGANKTGDVKLRAISAGKLLGESNVRLEPKRIVEARLTLNRSGVQNGDSGEIIRVDLIPSDNSLDSIAIDDTGYIDLGSGETKNILLVADGSIDETLLGLRSLGADAARASAYSLLSDESIKQYRAIVFHGLVPRKLPAVPSLIISPPLFNEVVPGEREVENPTISSWKTESVLTSYLNFSMLKLGASVVFKSLESMPNRIWNQAIVNVEQGPVIIAGEENGIRRVAVGFELLPFEGKKTPTVSILTLNLFSWLTGGAQFEETLRTGATLPVLLDTKWTLLVPGGETIESKNVKKADGSPRAETAGLYRLRVGDKERRIVVNAFHPDESATDERSSFEASYPMEPARDVENDNSFWRDILGIALILILLDLILRFGTLVWTRTKHA